MGSALAKRLGKKARKTTVLKKTAVRRVGVKAKVKAKAKATAKVKARARPRRAK
jgi:hypothetical protein